MKRLKEIKKKVIEKIVEHKTKIQVGLTTLCMSLSVSTSAFADISGETVKNNVIKNWVSPVFIIVFVVFIVKEFTKRNYAQLAIGIVIGCVVYAFVLEPDIAKELVSTLKTLFGV